MSFSKRCFSNKAIETRGTTGASELCFIVGSYFHYCGGYEPAQARDVSSDPGRTPPMYVVYSRKEQGPLDPKVLWEEDAVPQNGSATMRVAYEDFWANGNAEAETGLEETREVIIDERAESPIESSDVSTTTEIAATGESSSSSSTTDTFENKLVQQDQQQYLQQEPEQNQLQQMEHQQQEQQLLQQQQQQYNQNELYNQPLQVQHEQQLQPQQIDLSQQMKEREFEQEPHLQLQQQQYYEQAQQLYEQPQQYEQSEQFQQQPYEQLQHAQQVQQQPYAQSQQQAEQLQQVQQQQYYEQAQQLQEQQYELAQQQYEQPQQFYEQPQQEFEQLQHYDKPQQLQQETYAQPQYEQPPQLYEQPQQQFEQPPQQYEQPQHFHDQSQAHHHVQGKSYEDEEHAFEEFQEAYEEWGYDPEVYGEASEREESAAPINWTFSESDTSAREAAEERSAEAEQGRTAEQSATPRWQEGEAGAREEEWAANSPSTQDRWEMDGADVYEPPPMVEDFYVPTEACSVVPEEKCPLHLDVGISALDHPARTQRGGEDAHFIVGNWIGVADGFSGWAKLGVNSGLYSRELMWNCAELVRDECPTAAPKLVIEESCSRTDLQGSCTVTVGHMDGQIFRAAIMGDSGFMLIRSGQVVLRSRPMQHSFNLPYQVGTSGGNDPSECEEYAVEVQARDILLLGTDGLFDNVFEDVIAGTLTQAFCDGKAPEAAAQQLAVLAQKQSLQLSGCTPFREAARSHGQQYDGGKKDDITVIVAFVT
eukprot:TRINITY_DN243_c0_g1_i2.p1 TRINITY_DN243_c0_g1~~TRINITY_DN243_c0_g1_i2.p1  ORF type:complete len:762 (-),score=236.25 TRINITY_DN243_c0_g1_i2:1866-4151(-)